MRLKDRAVSEKETQPPRFSGKSVLGTPRDVHRQQATMVELASERRKRSITGSTNEHSRRIERWATERGRL